jgi:hypothetical protein
LDASLWRRAHVGFTTDCMFVVLHRFSELIQSVRAFYDSDRRVRLFDLFVGAVATRDDDYPILCKKYVRRASANAGKTRADRRCHCRCATAALRALDVVSAVLWSLIESKQINSQLVQGAHAPLQCLCFHGFRRVWRWRPCACVRARVCVCVDVCPAGDPDTNIVINRQKACIAMRDGFNFLAPALSDLMMVQVRALEAARAKNQHMCVAAVRVALAVTCPGGNQCHCPTTLHGTHAARQCPLPCPCATTFVVVLRRLIGLEDFLCVAVECWIEEQLRWQNRIQMVFDKYSMPG